ncbi:MAG: arginine repressor [Planctomycetota bacterium]|nr:arginine repressor [Planctomycetota bacterium]
MSGRVRRQQVIAELLSRQPVASQEDLRALLHDRGIGVTQATLSRDLREIGALKTMRGYQMPSEAAGANANGNSNTSPGTATLARALAGFVTSVEPAGNLIVLHTGPGHAQLVALEIDRAGVQGVVGCLAGDDTVFIAANTTPRARELTRDLRHMANLMHTNGDQA